LNVICIIARTTYTHNWSDLNHDDIEQDNEIGLSTNPNFGKLASVPKFDPHFKREYNLQYSAGIQHQVTNGVSLSFNWFRRTNYNGTFIQNRAVDPTADWTPFTIIN